MKFVTLSKKYENTYKDFIQEFRDINEEIIPFGADCRDMCFDEFLLLSEDYETGNNIPEEHVTAHTYYLVVKNEIVGAINCRHELKGVLHTYGHIGYGVKPSARRKGYADKMLTFGLEKYRAMNIERILIACDSYNIGSAKTILKNGGILENEIDDPARKGYKTQRYWIEL